MQGTFTFRHEKVNLYINLIFAKKYFQHFYHFYLKLF